MTSESESEIARPSIEGSSGELAQTGSAISVRKRVIMTKKFWSAEDVRRLFRQLDQDSSGRLSFEEFASGLKELGFEMKGDAAKALYRKMDVDGDGRVTEDEFLKLMRNLNREKLASQLSSMERSHSTTTRKPKAINITVLDVGYSEEKGHYKEYNYTRANIDKYAKDFPAWKKHCRWIDIYGNDPAILDLIGNECDLSSRMVDETTVKHNGKVQYYPEENALLVAVHALFLTNRPIQLRAQRIIPGSRIAALFMRPSATPTSPSGGIPMEPLEKRKGQSMEKKHFEADEDDEAEDDDGDEKKAEADTDYELMPQRFYETPKVVMSQIVIIALKKTIVTVRRRSNNTNIQNIFNVVKEDLKNFVQTEIRSGLEAPTSRDLLLTFLNEVHEHNHTIRNTFDEWKLALEKDINHNLNKYQARHLLDLTRATSKSIQIIEPYTEDFVALNSGEGEHHSREGDHHGEGDTKGKVTRQSSLPTSGDEKNYRKQLASATGFIGEKKTAFSDCGESAQRLLSQFKYTGDSAEQLGTYYKHQMDDRQSKALGYLTVITGTIFPFQLFTGVYGMNFDVLPELHWEYSYLLFWIFNLLCMCVLLKFWHSRGFL